MKPSDSIKNEILDLVKQYHDARKRETEAPFKPGSSRVPYAARLYDENEMVNLVDSSLEFWLTYGRFSKQFEERLAAYLGVKNAFLVNSGSSANLLAFSALTSPWLKEKRIRRGDEVITVAAGFPTTIAPMVQYGAVPVLLDIDLATCNIDTAALESARTDKTRAVMLAHTLGNPFDIRTVKDFCDKHGLWLIEDNCDALGARYDGKLTGSFGHIGTSSFYPPHHMTMGEGGAVYTSDPMLARIILSLRDWGRDCWCESGRDDTCTRRFSQQFGTLPFGYDHKYVYSHFGYNLKVSDMQAAVGVAQLDKLDGFVAKRRENFDYFRKRLSAWENFFVLPEPTPNSEPSWFGFVLTIKPGSPFTRHDIVTHLEEAGIQTRNVFGGNMTRQPVFEDLTEGVDYRIAAPLTNTDIITTDTFWFGVWPGLADDARQYVADTVDAFMSRNA